MAAWAGEGGTVVPLPGASAVLAAVAGSGVAGPRWAFEGFLPRSGRERRERLARIAADERGTVLFEAPSRVTATLWDLAAVCGRDRSGAVCRELTKMHESFVRGTLAELAEAASDGRIPPRGEFVLVVGPDDGRSPSAEVQVAAAAGLEAAIAEVERLVAAGTARGDRFQRKRVRKGHAARHAIDDRTRRRCAMTFPYVRHQRGGQEVRACCFRLGAGGKETPEVGQARIAHGREQQPCLAGDAPSLFDRHRHAFMKPAGQWLAARLTRKREVHDLVPNDRLQRVVRIRSGIRADTPGEDRDVMRAGRQAHDPGRSGACACDRLPE